MTGPYGPRRMLRAAVATARVCDATRCDETLNERPSEESAPGEAPRPPTAASGISWSGVATQAGLVIVPDTWFAVAAALLNVTLPKLVNGTTSQKPFGAQAVGASAIHSADETSRGCETVTVVEKRVLLVAFLMLIVTFDPLTSTAAVTRSPARTFSGTRTSPAGTISHQTNELATPRLLHCAVVPICGSVDEASLKPPIPTQKATASARPLTQCAFGCVQLPVTSPKVRSELADGAASVVAETAA